MHINREQKQRTADSDAYSLFLCAIFEMEAGQHLWHKHQYLEFTLKLQSSAIYLARALLSARGISVTEGGAVENLLRENFNTDDSTQLVYKNIQNVLSFDADREFKKENIKKIRKSYQGTLVIARNILARDLNYNEKIRYKLKPIFFTNVGLKKLSFIMLPLIVLISIPLAIYKYVDPIDRYPVDGQLFWKTGPNIPFTAKNSKRFSVISDNKNREYSIELKSPVNIFMLRLDPVNKIGLSVVEIEVIRLFGSDDSVLRELVFDNSLYWSCTNCIALAKHSNTYRMQPSNNDPYLTSSPINQDRVKKITIKMRAVSTKTFWEWILVIDKSLEF